MKLRELFNVFAAEKDYFPFVSLRDESNQRIRNFDLDSYADDFRKKSLKVFSRYLDLEVKTLDCGVFAYEEPCLIIEVKGKFAVKVEDDG